MRFSTVSATVLALVATGVNAADYRQTIQAPAGISMGLFEKAFFGMCAGFPPAHAENTAYYGPSALFEPGDYQGQNNDTIARAFCLYYSPDGSVIPMTVGVAQLLGGNSTEPNSTAVYQYWADGTEVSEGVVVSPGGANYSRSSAVETAAQTTSVSSTASANQVTITNVATASAVSEAATTSSS